MRPGRAGRRPSHERRVLLLALLGGLPALLVALGLVWYGPYTPKLRWTATILLAGFWWAVAWTLRERVVRPLQTLSNLLAALREEDFSIRARGAAAGDALGDVYLEVNALAATLRDQRLGALEAAALLRRIMSVIDVAIFAFDGEGRLRLVNRAGERLLSRPAERALGMRAEDLGLGEAAREDGPDLLDASFPGSTARWEVRRAAFHQGGLPHRLVAITDVSRALREEERQAWQRLIRVLGHELNNSLAPIRSIAGSLVTLLSRDPLPPDWREDARRGLGVIESRSEGLGRFMDGYARLARLPRPEFAPVEIGALVHRVTGLETRLRVQVASGPEATLEADPGQIEQAVINLVRNAADAALETGGGVRIGWRRAADGSRRVEVFVEDDGPGLPPAANLFVPFFTTKPDGSGIGLVLSRQIAEAHGGALTLENRREGSGCRALLVLPLPRGPAARNRSSGV